MDPVTLLFLIGGLALIASEVKLPGAVAGFFGVAAVLTAAIRGIGLVDSLSTSLLVWGVLTTALIIPLRPLAKKFAGRADVRRDTTDVDDDRDAMGEVVVVVEDITDDNEEGRIRFQGTTWQARSTAGHFKQGDKVQLVYRQGSIWVVEAVNEALERDLFAPADVIATVQTPAELEKKR
jgi:membrane protein implicated in regulation of membrane protease activity